MERSPSPVIHRALRFNLAELQSREALREQQRAQRVFTLAFSSAVIFFAALLSASLLATVLATSYAPDTPSFLTSALLCASPPGSPSASLRRVAFWSSNAATYAMPSSSVRS